MHIKRIFLLVAFFGGAFIRSATAQTNLDSLLPLLESSDWQDRDRAVFVIGRAPRNAWPAGFTDRVIALLEREGDRPDTASQNAGEGYGEYIINLVRVVLDVNDPRAIRAISLRGLGTGAAAKNFVASHGGAGIAYLDETWIKWPIRRIGVANTWGLMLGEFGDRLSRSDRLMVLTRVMWTAELGSATLARAAARGRLLEMVPVVELAVERDSIPYRQASALARVALLRRDWEALVPDALHQRLVDWLEALCLNVGGGARRGACESLGNMLSDAGAQIQAARTRPARNVLDAFVRRADQAFQQGALTDLEHVLLVENARFLITKL